MKDLLINKFKMLKHPEGGYFSEIYRSDEKIEKSALPERYSSGRNFGTSIYFMLTDDDISAFHRLKSDEFWYFHSGCTIEIHIIHSSGKYEKVLLGSNFEDGINPSILLPKGCWFGAKLTDPQSYGFVSCAVFPGFDFEDFELAKRKELLELFPQHKNIICELTKDQL